MTTTRRTVLRAGGVGLLSFYVGGCERRMSPEQARDAGAELRVLSPEDAASLEKLGDVLLPGSAAAGLAHFIDHQLGAPASEFMLMIKYLGPPPYVAFYRSGLAALDKAADTRTGQAFAELSSVEAAALVGDVAAGNIDGWDGPPAPFFYFVLRNDACDVMYGTKAGFAALGVPYMAHVEPPSRWGE